MQDEGEWHAIQGPIGEQWPAATADTTVLAMARLFYVTHPEVNIDPSTPVPQWPLSDTGRERARSFSRQSPDRTLLSQVGRVVSSDETKAREAADIIASALGVTAEVREGLGENDRSATGFVPPDEFENLADAFFADPENSIRGWETACDAQARIVRHLADLLQPSGYDRDVVVVGHGGVGTLWYCHLMGLPIDRQHDQARQGSYFAVDLASGKPEHAWQSITG